MFDPISLLTAGIPLLTAGGQAVIDIVKNKYAPDAIRPSNVGEAVQLQESQIKLYTAMNSIGGQSYQWVEAIIKLQRPLVVVVIMAIWAQQHMTGADTTAVDNAAAAVGFYLFADRTLFYTRKAAK